MEVGFIISERYKKSAYPWNVVRLCRNKGHEVQVIVPEKLADDLEEIDLTCDIYIHRNHTVKGLKLLKLAEKSARVFNSYESVMSCQDKIVLQGKLEKTSLLVPKMLKGDLWDLDENEFPIIIKPQYGNNGKDITVLKRKESLQYVNKRFNDRFFVQKYVENKGYDIKLYCIDKEVFAVKKKSPIHPEVTVTEKLIPCTPEMRRIANVCSEILNLKVFGVDTVMSESGEFYVIEVNECSGFRKVPNLANRIYDVIVTNLDRGTYERY
jgi:glutathione synthase/RimK-type ligase-like ATP-grasp enzyme